MSQRIADILSMVERLDLAQRLQVLAFLLDRGVPTHEHGDGTRVNLSALIWGLTRWSCFMIK